MGTVTNPLTALYAYILDLLPSGARLHWGEEDTIQDVAEAGARQDNHWYLVVRGQEPNIDDLNDNRQGWLFALQGVWSTTTDPVKINHVGNIAARVVRKLETNTLPDGFDLVEVYEYLPWVQRYKLTVVEIPLRVKMQLEEV